MDAISINISGRRFDISQDTFLKLSQAMPAKLQSCPCSFTNGRKEYFFEHHAGIFECILHYYQTGDLHMPQCICPLLLQKELEFWGVDPRHLSKCCYNRYALVLDNQKRLREFEEYFKPGKYFKAPSSRWQTARQFGWQLMTDPFSSVAAEIYFWISTGLVILNILAICLATNEAFHGDIPLIDFPKWFSEYLIRHYGMLMYKQANVTNLTFEEYFASDGLTVKFSYPYLFVAQIGLFGYFSVEFCCLVLFCPSWKAFASSPLHIVDLLALLPWVVWFILDAVAPHGAYIAQAERILGGLSILRVFRLLRLARRIKGLRILLFSVKSSLEDVFLLTVMLLMSTVIFASIMFYVDDRQTFPSILHGFWWAIVTMTTVGYGDQVPKSAWGKILGSACAVTGVIIVALTVPVFVSKFQLYYTNTEIPRARAASLKDKVLCSRGEKSQVQPAWDSTASIHRSGKF